MAEVNKRERERDRKREREREREKESRSIAFLPFDFNLSRRYAETVAVEVAASRCKLNL